MRYCWMVEMDSTSSFEFLDLVVAAVLDLWSCGCGLGDGMAVGKRESGLRGVLGSRFGDLTGEKTGRVGFRSKGLVSRGGRAGLRIGMLDVWRVNGGAVSLSSAERGLVLEGGFQVLYKGDLSCPPSG